MWGSILSAFTSDIPRDFPYNVDRTGLIKDELTILQRTIATHKSDDHYIVTPPQRALIEVNGRTQANAYVYDKKTGSPEEMELVQRIVKNAKTVRHPFIVSVLEVLETTAAFYVITEKVTKLSECLIDPDATSLAGETMPWNLKCVSEAIQFLHETANLTHGSLSIESICCCVDGQWKICLMETAVEARSVDDALVSSPRSDNFEWSRHISSCSYFTTPIVGVMGFFKDFALKGNWDKERFLDSTLNDAISQQPVIVQTRVLLPRVARLFREESLLPTTLRPAALRCFARLLGNAGSYSEAEFNSLAWPSVLELFKDPQRSTRYIMLQTLGRYENLLSQSQDEALLQLILPGLLDTSMELRDVTLRSVASIIPRLPVKSTIVNNALKTIMGLIQQDASEQIRTNGVICLSRLATFFPADKIAPGVIVGVNDSFPPCRLAAIQCIQNIAGSLSPKETANSYIPTVSRHLLDSDPECSRAAYHALRELIEKWSPDHVAKVPESRGTFFKISNDRIYSTLWGRKNTSTPPTKDTDVRKQSDEDGAVFEDAISPDVNSGITSHKPGVDVDLGMIANSGPYQDASGGIRLVPAPPVPQAPPSAQPDSLEHNQTRRQPDATEAPVGRRNSRVYSASVGLPDKGQPQDKGTRPELRSGDLAPPNKDALNKDALNKDPTWGPAGLNKTASVGWLAPDLTGPSPGSDKTETDFWNGMDGDGLDRNRVMKRSLKTKRRPAAVE
ncbi:putative kinase [Gregarina niphandrodes]|uniref:Kinase n=1 Tax=Gregarina niphandrodes TaxID=110365 RepID=A0A023B7T5_GRENI|nr:putative kinase [Gregarina niphandrodes]EZG67681.1 putative kinase [Gregarina niphandrodes]|eukprot:XP_011130163.1 putative kinase [Gregarina niphandrodes]